MPLKFTTDEPRVCEHCGIPFFARRGNIKRGWGKFCSTPCRIAAQRATSVMDRFWSKVNKTDGCWLWTAGTWSQGYGAFSLNGKNIRATRFIYELTYGPIPDGLLVCHNCDNPRCVRPDHLFLGTIDDNNQDMKRKGRYAQGSTHGSRTKPERVARGNQTGSHLHPESRPRGENNWNARLTTDQVTEMRRRYDAGEVSTNQLANEYGIHQSSAWAIVRHKTWTHIP